MQTYQRKFKFQIDESFPMKRKKLKNAIQIQRIKTGLKN